MIFLVLHAMNSKKFMVNVSTVRTFVPTENDHTRIFFNGIDDLVGTEVLESCADIENMLLKVMIHIPGLSTAVLGAK